MRIITVIASLLLFGTNVWAQYTPSAAQNAPKKAYRPVLNKRGGYVFDAAGKTKYEHYDRAPKADRHGNASGSQYDLAIDGAFRGQTILILDQVGNTLTNTRASLAKKGFATVVFRGRPTVKRLRKAVAGLPPEHSTHGVVRTSERAEASLETRGAQQPRQTTPSAHQAKDTRS
jgi:hypothetical protein